MKLTKTDARNRLSTEALSCLLLIQLLSPNVGEYEPDEAIKLWLVAGPRKRRNNFKQKQLKKKPHMEETEAEETEEAEVEDDDDELDEGDFEEGGWSFEDLELQLELSDGSDQE